jgi:hypothetical protein
MSFVHQSLFSSINSWTGNFSWDDTKNLTLISKNPYMQGYKIKQRENELIHPDEALVPIENKNKKRFFAVLCVRV